MFVLDDFARELSGQGVCHIQELLGRCVVVWRVRNCELELVSLGVVKSRA